MAFPSCCGMNVHYILYTFAFRGCPPYVEANCKTIHLSKIIAELRFRFFLGIGFA